MQNSQAKLIIIVGPTASGKSKLAVKLAKKFNGEIVSADSRQIYKGLDIGAGKITKGEMEGIVHHLLDIASPKRKFTVVQYRKKALGAIQKIVSRGKIPFLVGGTGFYIQALASGLTIPEVSPDWKLRKRLEKKNAEELFKIVQKLDPARANTIDRNNKRRLIRAIEIVKKTKKPVPPLKKIPFPGTILFLGIKKTRSALHKSIKKRLLSRLKKGMVAEVKRLKAHGLSWKRMEELGLEYKFIAKYLQGELCYPQMVSLLEKAIKKYADRQMTWFKKDKRILWVQNKQEAMDAVKRFLLSNGLPLSQEDLQ